MVNTLIRKARTMALTDTIAGVVNAAKDLLNDDSEAAPAGNHIAESYAGDDAIEILKDDHRKVEALFKEILSEKSSTLVAQRKNIASVIAALTLHAKLEETLLYPAVYGKTKRDSDERLEVLEAFEEHGSMKDLIKKIKKATVRDESLKAKVQVLCEITSHHVKEEESTFFPEAKKLLGEKRLKEIGTELAKRKARAARAAAPAKAARKQAVRAKVAAKRKKRA